LFSSFWHPISIPIDSAYFKLLQKPSFSEVCSKVINPHEATTFRVKSAFLGYPVHDGNRPAGYAQEVVSCLA